jgi:hypothetical protein
VARTEHFDGIALVARTEHCDGIALVARTEHCDGIARTHDFGRGRTVLMVLTRHNSCRYVLRKFAIFRK